MTEQDLRDHFYQFGEIRSISIVPKQQCAFVQFTKRDAAELAAEKSFNKLILLGRRLTVRWGKGQAKKEEAAGSKASASLGAVPGLPSYGFLGMMNSAPDVAGPSGSVYYPSMDPMRMGGGGGE